MSQFELAWELPSCSHSACDAVVAVVPASSTAAAHCRNAGAPLPLRASCAIVTCVFVVMRLPSTMSSGHANGIQSPHITFMGSSASLAVVGTCACGPKAACASWKCTPACMRYDSL